MTQLAESLLSEAHAGMPLPQRVVSKFSPQEIRESIAALVKADRLSLAHALLDAGLSLYPSSEDMLVIGVLMAEMEGDWPRAKRLMHALMQEQEPAVPEASWQHWVRILRCNHEFSSALLAVRQALEKYPESEALRAEHDALSSLCETLPPAEPAAHNH